MSTPTLLAGFFHHPQRTLVRRIIFQIHLWMGMILGLYLMVIGVTGAALMFEDEIAASMNRHLFHVQDAGGTLVDMDSLVRSVHDKYPNKKIWRIYAPTSKRDTFLISVEDSPRFRMVFAHPSTGAIVGELRREGFMSSVWNVHANLVAGDAGRRVNCTLGLFVLVLFGTGLVIWWPGAGRWWRALGVSGKGGWLRVTRQIHGAVGIWTFAFLVITAATGALYYYGPQFYRILAVVSVRNDPAPMQSDSALDGKVSRPRNQDLVAQAMAAYPGKSLWGFYPPMSAKASIQVVIGPIGDDVGRHTWDWDATDHHYLYFDQYSGRLLGTWDVRNRSVADVVRAWVVPLHRGTFDGLAVRVLWTILGLVPAVLFVAGTIMWWNRVLRPWRKRRAG